MNNPFGIPLGLWFSRILPFCFLAIVAVAIYDCQPRLELRREPARADLPVTPAADPLRCLREKRVHIYGTFELAGAHISENYHKVDLHMVECLEWEIPDKK